MQDLNFSQNLTVVRQAGRSWEQSRILRMHPAHSTTKGVGKPPNLPSTTQPPDLHLTPYKKPAHLTLTPVEEKMGSARGLLGVGGQGHHFILRPH